MKTVYSYSRKQAIEDGILGDVSVTAREAGIKYPTAITSAVHDMLADIPKRLQGVSSYNGRLWDLLWMLRCKIMRTQDDDQLNYFMILPTGASRKKNAEFKAVVNGGDNGEPVITIMLPSES